MSYNANVSTTPPANSGDSKLLWSPDLFDAATGTYPIAIGSRPNTISYPTDSQGQIRFYEGSQLAGPSRYWPTSDDSGASAAYSADDKILADPFQASGSYSWVAAAPSASNGEVINEVPVIFSFAGCSQDTTPRPLKAYACVACGAERKEFVYRGYEEQPVTIEERSAVSSRVSLDGGQTWTGAIFGTHNDLVIAKTLFTVDIGTADPNLVRIKVIAGGATKDGTVTDYGNNAPFHLDCSSGCEIFALCIEG